MSLFLVSILLFFDNALSCTLAPPSGYSQIFTTDTYWYMEVDTKYNYSDMAYLCAQSGGWIPKMDGTQAMVDEVKAAIRKIT